MHKVTSRSSMADKSRLSDSAKSAVADGNIAMDLEDWRRAISTPTKYRVGSASFNMQPRQILRVGGLLVCSLFVVLLIFKGRSTSSIENHVIPDSMRYNGRYPLTSPIRAADSIKYRIAVITDMDHDSKIKNKDNLWRSIYHRGHLTVRRNGTISVEWDPNSKDLYSATSSGGRGMELSELVVFNGRLITVDDRTGIVYKINKDQAIPWLILADGNGEVSKGFKAEWATVKDKHLYIGGLGKEWTTESGEVLNNNPQWVKKIAPDGSVEHLDWHVHYNDMKEVAGFTAPGYIVHESAAWSDVHKQWFFLPRRASKERYDEKLDERRAANLLFRCDDKFDKIVWNQLGPESKTHGFSSFKFVPDTNDEIIIALKSEEDAGKVASYIIALDLKGNILMKETVILGGYKYEGIEFI